MSTENFIAMVGTVSSFFYSFISFLLITYRGQMAKLHIIYKYNLPIKTLKYTDTSKLNAHQKLQINTYMHTDEK